MRTRHSAGPSLEIEAAIEAFFAATKGGQWPVSVADGVRRIRTQLGRAAISEAELAELVKRYAAQHGLEISPETKTPKPRRVR